MSRYQNSRRMLMRGLLFILTWCILALPV